MDILEAKAFLEYNGLELKDGGIHLVYIRSRKKEEVRETMSRFDSQDLSCDIEYRGWDLFLSV